MALSVVPSQPPIGLPRHWLRLVGFLVAAAAIGLCGFDPSSAAARAAAVAGVGAAGVAAPGTDAGTDGCDPDAAHTGHAAGGIDVWGVNTRTGGDPWGRVERFEPGRGWLRSDADALFDGSERPLILLVHGNRYEHADALDQALRLARRIGGCGAAPVPPRVVVYSWPSDKQGILLKDSRRKYERARCEAERFARFLGRIEPERPVGILGYSYGALVTLAGIESLANRSRADGAAGPAWIGRPGPVHLVLVASAVRHDALAPWGPYRAAAEGADRIVLLNNSADRALRFFPWVDRGLEVDALGRVGMAAHWLPRGVELRQYDAAAVVGPSHRLSLYLESGGVSRQICSGLLEGLATE